MYNKLCVTLFIASIFILASCGDNNNGKPANVEKHDTTAIKVETEQVAFPDSTELYFYKDPNDLKTNYKQAFNADSAFRSSIIQQIHGTPLTQSFECVFDAKIYLFKNGEPYKTVYAAYKAKDCQYLCYVKDGHKVFFPITPAVIQVLQAAEARPQRIVE